MTADLDLDLAFAHHLLAVPDDVRREEIEALAGSWFPHAAWLRERSLRLTAGVVLTGPWSLTDEDQQALHLPPHDTEIFVLRCPVQRGGPPPPELVDPTGLTGAFQAGVPEGAEAEALEFLLAAARRLGGALRVAGSGSVLAPDPDADVNLRLHSPVWLEPEALVAVLSPVLPSVRLAMELDEEAAADVAGEGPLAEPLPAEAAGDVLDPGERAWLHAEATAFDEAVLAQEHVFEAYGAVADLGRDGMIEVGVEGEDVVPLALQGLDWAERGVVAYAVRWWPADERALPDSAFANEDPPEEFRAARARARGLVERAAVALHAVVGGEVADEAGFLVDPASLTA